MNRFSLFILLYILCVGNTTRALEPYLGSTGYASSYAEAMTSMDLHIPLGFNKVGIKAVTGVVPEWTVQFGNGSAAGGISYSLSHMKMTFYDPSGEAPLEATWSGNLIVFARTRHCGWKGNTKFCIGGQFELSVAPSWTSKPDKIVAGGLGGMAMMRASSRFDYLQTITSAPLLVFNASSELWFMQFYVGPEVRIYLDDEIQDDANVSLAYGAALGISLFDVVSIGAGIRAMSDLTYDDDNSYGSFDLLAQADFDWVRPYVIFGIPIDESVRHLLDVVITAGVMFPL